MPSTEVSVKWGKEKYTLEANSDESPEIFKAQIFALTGVQPDRQKIMLKGKTLSNDSWDGFPLKSGAVLMMMGSADTIPIAPTKKTVFLEDLTDAQKAAAMDIPPGLKNLGNTCYMNATLQCLKAVPELRDALKEYRGNLQSALGGGLGVPNAPEALTTAVRDLYVSMDKTSGREAQEVIPFVLLQVLHLCMPQFAEKDDHGHLMQQDANECWLELMRMFQQKLPGRAPTVATPSPSDAQAAAAAAQSTQSSFITQYFGGRLHSTMKCVEAEEEPASTASEDFLHLGCYLSQEVKYLHSGLKAKLSETLEKRSPTLDRDAKYQKDSLISRLPAYLTVQMMRFYYKEKDNINAKVLKDVKFPMMLDVFDLCTPELKKRLTPARDCFKEEDDRVAVSSKADPGAEREMKKTKHPFSFPDDVGSNNSGYYELIAVLTHKGRSSNSGHYVGWVRRSKDDWVMCDDDLVRHVTSEDVAKLSGGGDWHCAYVLLYGPRVLETPTDQPTNQNGAEAKMDTDLANGKSASS